MQRLSILFCLLLLSSPTLAVADSDGYYCAGEGYLRSPPIHLEDFQVHGMSCRDSVVELRGWTTTYAVDFSNPAQPSIQTFARPFDPEGAPAVTKLGHWAKPGVFDLSPGGAPEFQLVIARTSRLVEGGIEHFTQTDLIWRDRSCAVGSLRGSERLFVGLRLETVDS